MQVLVIDDDVAVRQTIALLLEDAGIEVVQAADGKEGFRSFQRARPDLIVTDIIMPGMLGTELAERVKAAHPETKVMYISGYGDLPSTPPFPQRLTLRAQRFYPVRFHLARAIRSLGFRVASRTAEASKPECIMQFAQRGSFRCSQ